MTYVLYRSFKMNDNVTYLFLSFYFINFVALKMDKTNLLKCFSQKSFLMARYISIQMHDLQTLKF